MPVHRDVDARILEGLGTDALRSLTILAETEAVGYMMLHAVEVTGGVEAVHLFHYITSQDGVHPHSLRVKEGDKAVGGLLLPGIAEGEEIFQKGGKVESLLEHQGIMNLHNLLAGQVKTLQYGVLPLHKSGVTQAVTDHGNGGEQGVGIEEQEPREVVAMGHDEVRALTLLIEFMHTAGNLPFLLILVGVAQHTVVGVQFCLYALTLKLLSHHAGPGGIGWVSRIGSPHHQYVLLLP